MEEMCTNEIPVVTTAEIGHWYNETDVRESNEEGILTVEVEEIAGVKNVELHFEGRDSKVRIRFNDDEWEILRKLVDEKLK